MGLRISLSVPSLLSSWQSLVEESERDSHVRMFDSTSMANSGVVPAITGNANRPSNPSSRPRRSVTESRSQITLLQLEGSLHLIACPVSGNSMRCKAFLRVADLSLVHGEETPTPHTMQHGINGIAGVFNEVSIPFQHLWWISYSF